jgi:hypothetical protein
MKPAASDAKAIDPQNKALLVEAALDLLVNLVALDHEDQHFYPHPIFDEDDHRIAKAIRDSMGRQALKRFSGVQYDKHCILSGFECATQDLPYEVGLLAWTDEHKPDVYRYLVASAGTSTSVSLPLRAAGPKLDERIRNRTPTKVLVVHNHPRGPFKDMLEDLLGGTPLGPSGTDRTTTWSWLNIQVASNFIVQPEFVLHESGQFRTIKWPSADMIKQVLLMLQR